MADRLSVLPVLKARPTIRSGSDNDDNDDDALSCRRWHTFWEVNVSNIPSDATTKYLFSGVKRLQPVTSGSAVTPYLEIT